MPSDEYLWRARMENEWADTKAAAKRAEAAEARAAELERGIRDRNRIINSHIRKLESRLARAERLAEVLDGYISGDEVNLSDVIDALRAFRSTEPQPAEYVGSERHEYSGRLNPVYKIDMNRRIERPAAESEPHPDTVRIDNFVREGEHAYMLKNNDGFVYYPGGEHGVYCGQTFREAIDAAIEGGE